MRVELDEALSPALLGCSPHVRRKPLANLEPGAPVGLVVELEPEPRLKRFEAVGQMATYPHDAIKHTALGNVGEIDVHLHPDGRIFGKHLDEPLKAAGSNVKFHLVERSHAAGGP